MLSAIDFGKNFLTQLYDKRDVDAAVACCADDVVWITPNEIRHFRSGKSIRDFVVSSLEEDQNAYHIDYAATLSVPDLDTAGIVVYDVNLIPKHKESSVNIRCSLALKRRGNSYELVFVGMSRRWQRTDVEQIRTFADALPGGIMTLTAVRKEIRLMYASAFFYERLGYTEEDFYQKLDANLFFMLPQEEQKRMRTLVAEMSALSRPKPLSMQVTLLHADGQTQVVCHMTITAAYKEGDQTILYLLFDELTDVLTESERQQRRREKQIREEVRREQAQKMPPIGREPSSAETDQLIAEIRRDAEKRIAAVQIEANVHVEEAYRLANEEADAAEQLIRMKLEEAARTQNAAVEKTRREVNARYAAAWKEEKEKHAAEKTALTAERDEARQAAEAAQSERASLQEQLQELETQRQQDREHFEERIQRLEQALKVGQTDLARQQEELRQQETARLASDTETARVREELAAVRGELQQAQREAQDKAAQLSDVISRQQQEMKNQQLALQKKDVDCAVISKERDKSVRRMECLLQGQLQSVRSIAGAAGKERRVEELRRQMAKIAGLTDNLPALIGDLAAVATIHPGERRTYEDSFTLTDCMNLVRGVIRPQCREKGIIFSIETEPGMPDKVIGSKAGLELAFLCILENAVENTLSGGQITLKARSETAVRGSAYYSFTVTDTGVGIPEDRLAGLFDNPRGELSIARQMTAAMGGSIQVRSREGQGASFEIRVSLKLQQGSG